MRLKAFSFIEVMVAIVISGIVIGTVYSVLIFSYKQFHKYTAIKTATRNYFEFLQVFNMDFEQAKEIVRVDEQEIKMNCLNKQIIYEFEDEFILRTVDIQTDTFFLINSGIEANIVDESSGKNSIDYITISVKEQPLTFYKNYGAIIHIEQ